MKTITSIENIYQSGKFGDYQSKNEEKLIKVSEVKNLFICQVVKYKNLKIDITNKNIDGLNLPDIGDSIGQTVGGVGSGLIGGLSRGLGIGWRLIIIFGFILITSYILNIFKIITDISSKFIGKNK